MKYHLTHKYSISNQYSISHFQRLLPEMVNKQRSVLTAEWAGVGRVGRVGQARTDRLSLNLPTRSLVHTGVVVTSGNVNCCIGRMRVD